ncbi:dephospho-CoA kinase [Candidatus Magnetobacterium bavaricum]|uniref:Dephospho-CoA kinase n=1 Tax=Candidatus Magnetobacterium bavaricum TaxID=29290 RepID=A0A0F3GTW6_9BACT|nr:dephospho-CoA kinase [Candidatus Magnetobacterium bavaricum]
MLIGLTGNFGTGKSTVLGLFRALGAVTVSADEIVHRLLGLDAIKETLVGVAGDILAQDGSIDKRKMAGVVFSDAGVRVRVEGIIHPHVMREIKQLHQRSGGSIVVAEIPLLFEGGFERDVDVTITVTSTPEAINQRLIQKGYSQEEAQRRLAAQMSDSKKVQVSNYVIDNSSTLDVLQRQVEAVFDKLTV